MPHAEEVNAPASGRARREMRIFRVEPVELTSLTHTGRAEPTVTQNISIHGARVSTQRVWEPGSFLSIRSIQGTFEARARVVYWRSFSSSRFTVGLEFLTHEGEWPPSNESPSPS